MNARTQTQAYRHQAPDRESWQTSHQPPRAKTSSGDAAPAGSGTTLIASERLGRVCRTMDNDPKYIAVCLERWSQMVGEQPTLDVT